ncbi:hypothetical protein [Macellibacteroides fermentans]|jgi:hypothetical protein|uniref:Uncharacterized protein n=1 Tax=Macellibacteroides fermentans TaxID=879969 RepID=A0A8E2D470_9PORP|nr:hypothetical protein [Macellibacteroides fermentans]NYI49807.1 hypothetical protein [Macellibacteroides fermentans]
MIKIHITEKLQEIRSRLQGNKSFFANELLHLVQSDYNRMIDKAHETIPEQSSDQHFELLREYKMIIRYISTYIEKGEVKLEDFLSDPDCIEVPEKVEQIMALVENILTMEVQEGEVIP